MPLTQNTRDLARSPPDWRVSIRPIRSPSHVGSFFNPTTTLLSMRRWATHACADEKTCPDSHMAPRRSTATAPGRLVEKVTRPPFTRVAAMVKNHLPNVLSYYNHRLTNAVSEGINSAIQTIKKRAFEYRNPENLRPPSTFTVEVSASIR